MLHDLQSRFRDALLSRDDRPLDGFVLDDGGIPAARRIAVHRNTLFGTLAEALETAFPVVRALVGGAFFGMTARAFIQAHPPGRPDLAGFGGLFAGFLDRFPPAAAVPYLGDVARLEWARVEATFAADAVALALEGLAAVPPERVPHLRFTLHPTARFVRSRWPVFAIWEAHQSDPVASLDPDAGAESLVLFRPDTTLVTLRLDPAAEGFLTTLAGGGTLAAAVAAALAVAPGFDLQGALAALLRHGLFTAATPDPHEVPAP